MTAIVYSSWYSYLRCPREPAVNTHTHTHTYTRLHGDVLSILNLPTARFLSSAHCACDHRAVIVSRHGSSCPIPIPNHYLLSIPPSLPRCLPPPPRPCLGGLSRASRLDETRRSGNSVLSHMNKYQRIRLCYMPSLSVWSAGRLRSLDVADSLALVALPLMPEITPRRV